MLQTSAMFRVKRKLVINQPLGLGMSHKRIMEFILVSRICYNAIITSLTGSRFSTLAQHNTGKRGERLLNLSTESFCVLQKVSIKVNNGVIVSGYFNDFKTTHTSLEKLIEQHCLIALKDTWQSGCLILWMWQVHRPIFSKQHILYTCKKDWKLWMTQNDKHFFIDNFSWFYFT